MARKSWSQKRSEDYFEHRSTGPVPRHRISALVEADLRGDGEPGLAEAVTSMWVSRRAQLSSRNLMDLRMLNYLNPEAMEHHWSNWLTGAPLEKLRTKGLSIELQQWPLAVIEALNGLLAGHKPMAYQFDVMPDDPSSDSSVFQAEVHEKWLYREQDEQDYPTVYSDLITYFNSLGRASRLVTMHPKSKRIRTIPLWPGHLATFWQEDGRTIEQVIVARNMSVGEAASIWPDRIGAIESAVYKGLSGETRREVEVLTNGQQITVLGFWARMDDEVVGNANILIGATDGNSSAGRLLLDASDDTEYPDIPIRITPRIKFPHRTPDESTGALQAIAGPVTEYAEVLAAYKDMMMSAVYPRFVASGFTARNAPRLDRTIGGVIPLPRADQRLVRLEESVNTVPPEQLLAHEEELIVLLSGLSKFFLGTSPSAETSGEAISASIHASIMRLEPQRSNIQRDEIWTYRMWSGLTHDHGAFEFEGRQIKARDILMPWPSIAIEWRDIRPREATREKQMALAGVQQGIISKDTARDAWSILSKSDEVRKITRERRNLITNPQDAASTAAAIIQMAQARQAQAQAAQPALPPGPPGAGAPPGAVAAEMMTDAAAASSATSFESDNEPGGVAGVPTTSASPAAPPPRGVVR